MSDTTLRILHTADWHLGTRRGPFARFNAEDDQFAAVERMLTLAQEHDVQVLLVAGDVFDAQPRDLPAVTKRLAQMLAPSIKDGLHVILLPGNHDRREHFRMMRALLDLGDEASHRLVVVEKPDVVTIENVAFALVPYPTKEALAPYLEKHAGGAPHNVALGTAYADLVRTFSQRLTQHDGPAVFCAHVTVAGVTTPSGHELNYDSDLRLGTADLPRIDNLAYIALGHIHQPQEISHVLPCHYSGSLDRLDWGEWRDEKQALLVDIPTQGATVITSLPLDVTPYYKLDLTPADILTLTDDYTDLDRAIVKITLTCTEDDNPLALRRTLLELCPRCNGVDLNLPEREDELKPLVESPDNIGGTTLGYLQEQFGSDPDYDELKALTQQFLNELSEETA